jgi:hypothetical protein
MMPISAAVPLYRGCQFYWWSSRRTLQTYRLSHYVVSSTPRHTIVFCYFVYCLTLLLQLTVPSTFQPVLYLYRPHWLTKDVQFLGVPRDW